MNQNTQEYDRLKQATVAAAGDGGAAGGSSSGGGGGEQACAELAKQVKSLLPVLIESGSQVQDEAVTQCCDFETKSRKLFYQRLREISEQQHTLAKRLSRKVNAIDEALKVLSKNVECLVDVDRIPQVYAAFIAEVARRRANSSLLRTWWTACRSVSTSPGQEHSLREAFQRRHGRLVLANLIPGITNVRPLSLEVMIRPSVADESLLDVDIDAAVGHLRLLGSPKILEQWEPALLRVFSAQSGVS